jgi:quercetin dioxygenase-like cupin family protein
MKTLALAVLTTMMLPCQSGTGGAVLANLATAKWGRDAGDPPGSESVTLRQDSQTGALELLVSYPAGHVFAPHWHSANERIVLLEGRMSMRQGEAEKFLDPGGYAFLPAKELQRMACVSKTRCTFYVYWDGKLDFHR